MRFFAYLLPALMLACGPASPEAPQPDYLGWTAYHGDKQGTHYSALDQINRDNVQQLEVAWTYQTGDSEGRQIQCNPLIVDTLLYLTTGGLKCVALHAATGREVWRFDPFADVQMGGGNNRGLAYWTDGQSGRIFHAAGPRLYALDALSGTPIADFGENGSISLHTGLGERAQDLWVIMTTPGVIFEDSYIVGSRVAEGDNSAPGFIRAFDVRSGALRWTFHTIPQPGEPGHETWPPQAYQTAGGVNSWAGMVLDEAHGLVFAPTGSAAPDPYGGNRAGDNLYANCLLALDARTGERVWHFQTIHHDLWDYDLPSPPVLLTLRRDGQEIPAVAQTTKTGNTFVFHRLTGEPLFPIAEVPVPPSDLAGEKASPTQPLPQAPPPFTRQAFTRNLITDRSPEARAAITAAYDTLRGGQLFIPPSLQGTIVFPGFDGGAEWGGPAVDPHRGILYVNANEMVWTVTMMEHDRYQARLQGDRSPGRLLYEQHCLACHGPDLKGDGHYGYPALIGLSATYTPDSLDGLIRYGKGMMPGFPFLNPDEAGQIRDFLLGLEDRSRVADTTIARARRMALPYVSRGFYRLLDPEGYPAIQPPWGTLSALDLNTGEMLWQVPLGEFPELTAQGVPRTGTENYGGPILTAGQLIFIGATKDEQFRAFDQESGAELWKYALPAGGYATPATYAVDGRQFVVIACGGDKMGTKSGDSFVAFALPVP